MAAYAPAQVNGGSRNFYTWWTLSVNREVTTSIFSWSSLNCRVGQKATKFSIFLDPAPANFLLSRPNAAEYCNSEKKLIVKHRWLLYIYVGVPDLPYFPYFGGSAPTSRLPDRSQNLPRIWRGV